MSEPTMHEIMRAFDALPRDVRGRIKDRADDARAAVFRSEGVKDDGTSRAAAQNAWEKTIRAGVLAWCAENPDESPLRAESDTRAPAEAGLSEPYESALLEAVQAVKRAADLATSPDHRQRLSVAVSSIGRVLEDLLRDKA